MQTRLQTKQSEPTNNVIIKTENDTIEIISTESLNTNNNNNDQRNNEQQPSSHVTIHSNDDSIKLEVTPKMKDNTKNEF